MTMKTFSGVGWPRKPSTNAWRGLHGRLVSPLVLGIYLLSYSLVPQWRCITSLIFYIINIFFMNFRMDISVTVVTVSAGAWWQQGVSATRAQGRNQSSVVAWISSLYIKCKHYNPCIFFIFNVESAPVLLKLKTSNRISVVYKHK